MCDHRSPPILQFILCLIVFETLGGHARCLARRSEGNTMRFHASIWFTAAVLAAGCKQATPAMQQDAKKAESATQAVAAKAGAELEKAGQKVSAEAQKVNAAAKPAAEDLALTAKIKSKLAAAPKVSALDIHVDTHDRVVTLTGTVDSPAAKDLAQSLARHTSGVKAVIDRLVVGTAASPSPATSPAY
jgi:hypothetical protein